MKTDPSKIEYLDIWYSTPEGVPRMSERIPIQEFERIVELYQAMKAANISHLTAFSPNPNADGFMMRIERKTGGKF